MGNSSSLRQGEGTEDVDDARNPQKQGHVDEDERDEEQQYDPQLSSDSDSMGSNPPPESPGTSARSPLMFSPQDPMIPISKENMTGFGSQPPGNYDTDSPQHEQGVPTIIQWTHGGREVYIEGSWDNRQRRIPLQQAGNDFTIVKILPPGVYEFNFVVDGEFQYSPDLQFTCDERGFYKNVLDVQENIPENVESISGFEPPKSPDVSYDSLFPTTEDFSKEPPTVPPQLHLTLLDLEENADSSDNLMRPQHVVLNHLYVEKGRTVQSVLALGLTHRFHSKYVTVVLYKPLPKTTSRR